MASAHDAGLPSLSDDIFMAAANAQQARDIRGVDWKLRAIKRDDDDSPLWKFRTSRRSTFPRHSDKRFEWQLRGGKRAEDPFWKLRSMKRDAE